MPGRVDGGTLGRAGACGESGGGLSCIEEMAREMRRGSTHRAVDGVCCMCFVLMPGRDERAEVGWGLLGFRGAGVD